MASIRTEAALLRAAGEPLAVGALVVDEPEPHEVLVSVSHVGLCHSDLHYVRGTLEVELPAVLGHEVAGVVERTGADVSGLRPGDRVVVSLVPSCGRCGYCESGRPTICSRSGEVRRRPRPAYTLPDGTPVARLADVGGFSRHILVRENAAVPLPGDVPTLVGCLLGCCVATGVGAVFHGAGVRPGSSVAVIGCGGVGSAVVQGARLAGASEIVAVDLSADRLRAAMSYGATATVDGAAPDVRAAVHAVVPGGVEFSFEAVGSGRTAELAVAILRPGGTATVVGIAPSGTTVAVPADALFVEEKRVIGSYMGSSRMHADVPEYARLYRRGALLLDEMVSEVVPLAEINDGFDFMRHGKATRVVVDMGA
ncbi:Zn-dependent alcohol dehydrogenase [Pseudonocardia sp. GCM10023141]|uniref:Zn-dependent alcohol dehydrogenase n=1 Tax=Pseudonocardia sp. GCM10023141 TaxID=3252653 RepID=UPI00361938CA